MLLPLGIATGYGLSIVLVVNAPHLSETELALVSMFGGGALAPVLLAMLAGWRSWQQGPFLVATGVVASLCGGGLGVGMVAVILAAGVYAATRRVGQMVMYYGLPAEDDNFDGPDDREGSPQNQANKSE